MKRGEAASQALCFILLALSLQIERINYESIISKRCKNFRESWRD